MGVGIKVGNITDEIGSSDFLHAFFSTVSANLEPSWGRRFPKLFGKLYAGELSHSDANAALKELEVIRRELANFPPQRVVWDIEDRTKSPPWGNQISAEITDLSNYFVTSTGRDLIETLREALEALRGRGGSATIVNTPPWRSVRS